MQTAEAFRLALIDAGLEPEYVEADGKIHRCRTTDDKGKKQSGWYVLFDDGIAAGAYGNWKISDQAITWTSREARTLTAEERRQLKANLERARAAREQDIADAHAEAATACREIWAKARDATDANGYTQRKGIKPYGCKMFGDRDVLIVPLYRARGELVNLQFIQADGTKRFKSGGEKHGCYMSIGRAKGGPKIVIVCEGFATGASIHAATGLTVVIAFDAGNLEPVAVKLRAMLPDWQIIIAGDNDANGKGQEKASLAATLTRAAVVIPDFSEFDIEEPESRPSDFNDLHTLGGLDVVRTQILERQYAAESADELMNRLLSDKQIAAAARIKQVGHSIALALRELNDIAITHRIQMGSVQCPQLDERLDSLEKILKRHIHALDTLNRLPVAPVERETT
ncbi:MAG: toprim domain-containing protein [Betaproteobacteria bacterium]|nr:toprim domain-containing protein [Betaproteobacteria bacterium]